MNNADLAKKIKGCTTLHGTPAPQLLAGDRVYHQGEWKTVTDLDKQKGVRVGDIWVRREDLQAVDDTGRWRHTGEQQ
ncbi:hypothetical protein ACWY4P_40740 [Streptomyces sp. LZ34]